uniref:DNA-directed RNA polymerase III subunit RPC3 n=1 Tax=Chromera velia CCMP2878 TaxID=1169474 RepID=A0A0G4I3M5_9ALVE|eukprot:Cvel_10633.t1-p1 / transcript=Cvel_10633.t1 / gene=Cvel_10633 / organism=Chromera_velia_CCMP2878 / gene_product=hypothetical protein / transcript_product=hypothetical protein / location=Cvel_scaffold646:773-6582(-) / protein_length=784 / sequence_SO=supercontig / SO=protein_coding / is_pseudo=false
MPNTIEIDLVVSLIEDAFGPVVKEVAEQLAQRGRTTVRGLISFTGFSFKLVRDSLLTLTQHNCVHTALAPYDPLPEGSGSSSSKAHRQQQAQQAAAKAVEFDGTQPLFYFLDFQEILFRLRYPKYLLHVEKNHGRPACLLLCEVVKHGRLSMKRAVDIVASQEPLENPDGEEGEGVVELSSSSFATRVNGLRSAFANLLHHNILAPARPAVRPVQQRGGRDGEGMGDEEGGGGSAIKSPPLDAGGGARKRRGGAGGGTSLRGGRGAKRGRGGAVAGAAPGVGVGRSTGGFAGVPEDSWLVGPESVVAGTGMEGANVGVDGGGNLRTDEGEGEDDDEIPFELLEILGSGGGDKDGRSRGGRGGSLRGGGRASKTAEKRKEQMLVAMEERGAFFRINCRVLNMELCKELAVDTVSLRLPAAKSKTLLRVLMKALAYSGGTESSSLTGSMSFVEIREEWRRLTGAAPDAQSVSSLLEVFSNLHEKFVEKKTPASSGGNRANEDDRWGVSWDAVRSAVRQRCIDNYVRTRLGKSAVRTLGFLLSNATGASAGSGKYDDKTVADQCLMDPKTARQMLCSLASLGLILTQDLGNKGGGGGGGGGARGAGQGQAAGQQVFFVREEYVRERVLADTYKMILNLKTRCSVESSKIYRQVTSTAAATVDALTLAEAAAAPSPSQQPLQPMPALHLPSQRNSTSSSVQIADKPNPHDQGRLQQRNAVAAAAAAGGGSGGGAGPPTRRQLLALVSEGPHAADELMNLQVTARMKAEDYLDLHICQLDDAVMILRDF